jgi:Domain of unknown function (DUF222)/HNH endonuclease
MCSPTSKDDLPLEALEREITELASHIHAATCRWLCLVADYDEREGWAQWGCRSCAHWVSWQCGVAPVAAREHVRIARRLRELPLIREAFAAGRLSYSKVRALTRVQDVEREQDLLDLARHATASQLERLVRGYRRVAATERAAAGGRPERWLTWDYDDDGSLLLRGRLPADEGALVIAAIEAARDRASADRRDASAEARRGQDGDASAEALPDDQGDAPVRAASVSVGEARVDALLVMADTLLAGADAVRSGGDRTQVVVHVDADTLQNDVSHGRSELESGAPLTAETARRLSCDASIVRLLERDGRPLSIGRKSRSIPPALRRALAARDRGCRFPGCAARRFVDAHHIEHWARGGSTELANLVQLCRHHHQLLHEGGYSVVRHADGALTFRRADGKRIVACPTPPPGHAIGVRERRPGDRARPIEPDACVSLSAGERLDLELGVQALLAFAPLTAEAPGM